MLSTRISFVLLFRLRLYITSINNITRVCFANGNTCRYGSCICVWLSAVDCSKRCRITAHASSVFNMLISVCAFLTTYSSCFLLSSVQFSVFFTLCMNLIEHNIFLSAPLDLFHLPFILCMYFVGLKNYFNFACALCSLNRCAGTNMFICAHRCTSSTRCVALADCSRHGCIRSCLHISAFALSSDAFREFYLRLSIHMSRCGGTSKTSSVTLAEFPRHVHSCSRIPASAPSSNPFRKFSVSLSVHLNRCAISTRCAGSSSSGCASSCTGCSSGSTQQLHRVLHQHHGSGTRSTYTRPSNTIA